MGVDDEGTPAEESEALVAEKDEAAAVEEDVRMGLRDSIVESPTSLDPEFADDGPLGILGASEFRVLN